MMQQIKYYKKLKEFLNSQLISHQVLHINLISNQIGDEDASGLGTALANCINLQNLTLELGYNKIGDKGASGLGSSLENCINLSNLKLDLSSNKIGDKSASGLGSALANCINLQNLTLELGFNQIGDRIEQKYSHIQMHSEYNLKINFYNRISGMLQLVYCVYLVYFYMEFFEIKGAVQDSNPRYHCQDPPTRPLEPLSPSQFGDEGASGLGSALAKCINLSILTLKLGYNKIGDKGASGLGSALVNCINLSNLSLHLQQKQLICFGL
ncbi:cyclic nucleotide-binding domain protein, putative (macronuclear) [Tetrahymena thermophila SB210]|uniref:Cyclic nucleotide-binding domain protein, putative n=1 Tax=Tetrahymena thermophila (strain SB210) TaxID=312017 RepID=W7X4Z6_TETTS|nr:cyclic nucleotide-binding domain protein, putative [Tetrahymena thermophila SB210]EWS74425.1 cyclic nucleotide-binding domain protein, putative [Tetrahymena thermophila SB210]|eukprot:XP_012653002.1 cyclic nucleotide-binding domain protein, putative [Tetrahymena thermophila SB210]